MISPIDNKHIKHVVHKKKIHANLTNENTI